MLKYDIVHIIGVSIFVFALIFSGILIKKYTGKYHNTEILWVPWWLVIMFIMGSKFI